MNDQSVLKYNKKCNFIFKVENKDIEKEVLIVLQKDKFVQQILNNISNYLSFKK